MQELSRMMLFRLLQDDENIPQNVKEVIAVNECILKGIEELFIIRDSERQNMLETRNSITSAVRFSDIQSALTRNISELLQKRFETISVRDVERFAVNLSRRVERIGASRDQTDRAKTMFNRVIKDLAEFSKMVIPAIKEYSLGKEKTEEMPQVFLSHAYDDCLYAYALFHFFYDAGIYLYVGWMHNDDINDGRQLKSILQDELEESQQLLLLRTPNSELDIKGKQSIRPWCSWEVGNYYGKNNGNEKFFLNLYSKNVYENIQLHGMKLLTGVSGGRMFGVDI